MTPIAVYHIHPLNTIKTGYATVTTLFIYVHVLSSVSSACLPALTGLSYL